MNGIESDGDRIGNEQFGKAVGVRQVVDRLGDRRSAGRNWVGGQRQPSFRADQEQPAPVLRNAEVGGVQHPVGQQHVVARFLKGFDQFAQKPLVRANRESRHVLEDAVVRLEFADQTDVVEHELVPGVVQRPLADQRKSLTGRAAEDDVDRPIADARPAADGIAGQTDDAGANRGRVGKVELVNRAVNRIDLDRRRNVEARLLESERQTARAREQVDADGSGKRHTAGSLSVFSRTMD